MPIAYDKVPPPPPPPRPRAAEPDACCHEHARHPHPTLLPRTTPDTQRAASMFAASGMEATGGAIYLDTPCLPTPSSGAPACTLGINPRQPRRAPRCCYARRRPCPASPHEADTDTRHPSELLRWYGRYGRRDLRTCASPDLRAVPQLITSPWIQPPRGRTRCHQAWRANECAHSRRRAGGQLCHAHAHVPLRVFGVLVHGAGSGAGVGAGVGTGRGGGRGRRAQTRTQAGGEAGREDARRRLRADSGTGAAVVWVAMSEMRGRTVQSERHPKRGGV
ncbi:hypothetical protein B0H17DRAFT_296323 [Mycena rosella]|uniref:Uncharacterized protein n=1 Tax=Mycena rosella TaxID=1033263 RepID=A0AAD7DUP7_MYCRO|nr:hypothetical protein B0H17DRAFT_296323 [Mycena rosella]